MILIERETLDHGYFEETPFKHSFYNICKRVLALIVWLYSALCSEHSVSSNKIPYYFSASSALFVLDFGIVLLKVTWWSKKTPFPMLRNRLFESNISCLELGSIVVNLWHVWILWNMFCCHFCLKQQYRCNAASVL